MVVVLALDIRRQRESKRMLRAPRMRREPTGRRGFTLFIVSQITCERAAHDQRASSSRIRRQHVRPAPTHGRQTSRGVGEARVKGIGERAACTREGREPRTSSCCSKCASAARLSACSRRRPQHVKPLVVKLSMVVVLPLDTRRQRESRRMLRAPRMRREPTNRRGFKQSIFLQNRS